MRFNGEEVDCVLSALFFTAAGRTDFQDRNVMNARVWLGLGKMEFQWQRKALVGGRIGQFFMKQIFKKEIEKSKKEELTKNCSFLFIFLLKYINIEFENMLFY